MPSKDNNLRGGVWLGCYCRKGFLLLARGVAVDGNKGNRDVTEDTANGINDLKKNLAGPARCSRHGSGKVNEPTEVRQDIALQNRQSDDSGERPEDAASEPPAFVQSRNRLFRMP